MSRTSQGRARLAGLVQGLRLQDRHGELVITKIFARHGLDLMVRASLVIHCQIRAAEHQQDGDVGLRRSINQLYNEGEALDDEETLAITDRWTPYRSVASWYLWRVIDGDIQNFK